MAGIEKPVVPFLTALLSLEFGIYGFEYQGIEIILNYDGEFVAQINNKKVSQPSLKDITSRIVECLGCSQIFYRAHRKQKYCSKRCINRITRRQWLKNPKNREKERQWARERYQRRVHKFRRYLNG